MFLKKISLGPDPIHSPMSGTRVMRFLGVLPDLELRFSSRIYQGEEGNLRSQLSAPKSRDLIAITMCDSNRESQNHKRFETL